MKGSYLLLIELPEEQSIAVGSLGLVHFPVRYYAYVGSALGGFKSRLNRHLRKDKKPQWHIDYLLQKAAIKQIIICETEDRVECAIARALSRRFDAVPSFGSSDCRCPSHLFFAAEKMEPEIVTLLNSLGLKPRLLRYLGCSKAKWETLISQHVILEESFSRRTTKNLRVGGGKPAQFSPALP